MPNAQYPSSQSRKPSKANSLKNLLSYSKPTSDSSVSSEGSKESISPGRKSSVLLDKILNEDTEVHDTGDSLSRNSVSLPDVSNRTVSDDLLNPGHKLTELSGMSLTNDDSSPKNKLNGKKSSHQRSVSDYGVQRSTPAEKVNVIVSGTGRAAFSEKQSLFDEGNSCVIFCLEIILKKFFIKSSFL